MKRANLKNYFIFSCEMDPKWPIEYKKGKGNTGAKIVEIFLKKELKCVKDTKNDEKINEILNKPAEIQRNKILFIIDKILYHKK